MSHPTPSNAAASRPIGSRPSVATRPGPRILAAGALVVAAGLLAGCGQKGVLRLPPAPAPAPSTAPSAPATAASAPVPTLPR